MEKERYLMYRDMKELKKGDIIMVRYEHKGYQWCMGTFLGHMSAYGSAAMKFAFDYVKNDQHEDRGYEWTTVFTGLDQYEAVWNDRKNWRNYRWPTEEELNENLLQNMEVGI